VVNQQSKNVLRRAKYSKKRPEHKDGGRKTPPVTFPTLRFDTFSAHGKGTILQQYMLARNTFPSIPNSALTMRDGRLSAQAGHADVRET
jgi:hypothetical protein